MEGREGWRCREQATNDVRVDKLATMRGEWDEDGEVD